MTLDEIRRRDLQLIAYHEAGHLIALTKLGGYGYISIEEPPEARGVRELRLYSGRVHIRVQPTADRDRVLIGLAGMVAEELLDDPLADAWELMEYIEIGGIAMSDTDAAMAKGFTVDDVEQTIRLLSDHWPEVQQAAEWEISAIAMKFGPLTTEDSLCR